MWVASQALCLRGVQFVTRERSAKVGKGFISAITMHLPEPPVRYYLTLKESVALIGLNRYYDFLENSTLQIGAILNARSAYTRLTTL
jgi:hypothetical protein